MKTKIQIKSIFGSLLFELECENNSIKNTVIEAVKIGANLIGSNLRNANLRSANLSGADLRNANLIGADLSGSNLRSANLRSANLSGSNLRSADLRNANLIGANLSGADLSGADHNENTGFLLSQCPDGAFIAYKKAQGKIVKIEVCEDAKRSSATTLKCRCSKAKCLEIQNIDGSMSELKEIISDSDIDFIYKVGEINEVLNFDEERFKECSTGIHFFIRREMAVKY
jgi:hypothetical protein